MRRESLAIITVSALVLAACASTSNDVKSVEANDVSNQQATDPVPGDVTGSLAWAPCDDAGNLVVQLECAILEVPLDYDSLPGRTVEIALARVQTTNSDSRIGSLVFNPGGPGASGIEFLESAAALVPVEVSSRFDLVSFDPRGVAASTAIECEVDLDDNISLLAAGDDEGWNTLLDEAKEFPDSCSTASRNLSAYVGTNNAARDLDLIREALGDDGLSYVGFSYGTRLGATYAELFPENVRALVLDGGVKPTDDQAELDREQAAGFDQALERFAAACDADDDCALAEVGPALDVYSSIVAQIDDEGSFSVDDPDRMLTPGEFQLGVAAALYSKQTWPILADGMLQAATQSDGTIFQALVDSYTGRRPDGTYSNSQVANGFINCADDPARPAENEIRQQADAAAGESKYFDEFLRADTGCIGSPAPEDPLILGPADGAPPILVIGNIGDPATPYEWSAELANSLISGVLFSVEAEGHTAYLSIPCVEAVVNSYLIDLEVPSVGASCSDNEDTDFFAPAGDSELELLIALFDCLRENGADVPELSIADLLADPSGSALFEALDPSDPDFVTAVLACEDLLGEL